MRILNFLLLSILFSIAACKPNYKEPHIKMETTMGDIELELYPDKAPKTVATFLKNMNNEVYKNASFYRVLKAEQLPTDYNSGIIQGGVHLSGGKKTAPFIPHESTIESGLSHNDGIISMARTTPGTASTEFFICIGDQSPLDYGRRGTPDSLGMAAFGKVIQGMDIVRKIHNSKSNGDAFTQPVKILDITRL